MKPQPFLVGVFCLPDRAGSRVLLGVPADCAGQPLSPFPATFHSLLAIPRPPELVRSPQRSQRSTMKDEAIIEARDAFDAWVMAEREDKGQLPALLPV